MITHRESFESADDRQFADYFLDNNGSPVNRDKNEQLNIHSVMQGLPEYNEIFYHARILDIDQFRDYWNSLGSPTEKNK